MREKLNTAPETLALEDGRVEVGGAVAGPLPNGVRRVDLDSSLFPCFSTYGFHKGFAWLYLATGQSHRERTMKTTGNGENLILTLEQKNNSLSHDKTLA